MKVITIAANLYPLYKADNNLGLVTVPVSES